jgi:hypothetical protein
VGLSNSAITNNNNLIVDKLIYKLDRLLSRKQWYISEEYL